MRYWLVPIVAVIALSWSFSSPPPADAAVPMFGDGSDGSIAFSANQTFTPAGEAVLVSGTAGSASVALSSVSGSFVAGDLVLLHQTRGSDGGAWELNTVSTYALGMLVTQFPLANSYVSAGANRAQILVVSQYTDLVVDPGVTVSAKPWDGAIGGIIAFSSNGTATVLGTISADAAGYLSPPQAPPDSGIGDTGEGMVGASLADSIAANGNGGGGGAGSNGSSGTEGGGGGGGHSVAGSSGGSGTGGFQQGGSGGIAAGTSNLSRMVFGGGGGQGGSDGSQHGWGGGVGGGIVFLNAAALQTGGSITSRGAQGSDSANDGGAGGGGAGGSVLLRVGTANLGSSLVSTTGGAGGTDNFPLNDPGLGGAGALGRIRAEYCVSIAGGNPVGSVSVSQISCEPDSDSDGSPDTTDNCPNVSNPLQENADRDFIDLSPPKAFDDLTRANSDALGDACDDDDDNDGLTDAEETSGSACGGVVTDPLLGDTDGDLFLDRAECTLGTDPTNVASKPPSAACGAATDADGDKVADRFEFCFYNTNVLGSDTDADGCVDGKEVASINADRAVSSIDLGQVAQHFDGQPDAIYLSNFDINKDGKISSSDLGFVAQNFGAC